ncbi:hypothetical protein PVL29_025462 [Vitis rotundifolia]|uniref:Wound-responsive family protein n=1 Tax=Vitis rotundifolia TaxID=103349 RepID=A0AA38YJS6_VITRO|nr:hypothetical protein PVL29_025462 [Vitis rotundifolia]
MSSTIRAWIVAASVGAVEALKDEGLCRWNHALGLQQQLVSSPPLVLSNKMREEKMKKAEESLRKLMYLSSWIAAASVGAVEALKDEGLCRWNHALGLLQQHGRTNVGSFSQAKRLVSSPPLVLSNKMREEKMKKAEESLRKVMYLSCWGPY